jgi:hypothetical protein
MSKHTITIATTLATALIASTPVAAEIRAELAGGYSSTAEAFAGVQAGAAIEKMTGEFSYKLSAGGEGTYASSGEMSGEATAAAQASVSLGQTVILGSVEGGGYSYAAGSGFTAGAGLSLTMNGSSASGKLAPRIVYDSGPSGYIEAGGVIGGSMLCGTLVFKPEADMAWTGYEDGSSAFTAIPSIGFSWYPGIPLSASLGAGFERSWPAEGGTFDSIPAKAALYGAIGGSAVWRLGATIKLALADLSISEASANAELAFSIARWDSVELELPVAASWNLDEAIGFSATAGMRLLLD